LLSQCQTPNDKWLVPSFDSNEGAWVIFEFAKPVLIRAVGITSANDEESRDPKDFSFQCIDVLEEKPSERNQSLSEQN